jgi:Acetyltransferase (GNAT) domain
MANYPILYDIDKISFGRLPNPKDAIDLFATIFERRIGPEIVHWFAACPTGSNQWYAAFEGDTPIGMYGILPIKISLGQVVYSAGLANNIGIIPRFRGQGLFQSLSEFAFKTSHYPFVLGTPNHQSVKGCKRVGCQSYGVLELLSGPGGATHPPLSRQNFQSVAVSNSNYLHLIKDTEFIHWRYSKPGFSYYQSFFEGDRAAIWKTYEGKYQILETNDFKTVFEFDGAVDIWQFKGSDSSEYLKSQGFIALMSNELLFYFNQPIAIEKNVNQYRFELGDNDVF